MHDMAIPITEDELLAACACHKVRMAARALTRAYDDALRPTGLRATQLSVLAAIAVDGSTSIAALAEVIGMDRTTLTRNIRPLERAGLISIGEEGFRRSRTLSVTAKGRARLKDAMPVWQRAQDGLQQRLGKSWPAAHRVLEELARSG
jgi:DNA-binding MarR family transcriptional regulator